MRYCVMPKPTKTVDRLTEEIRQIFGDRYDCSQIVYKNNSTPITLICPIHGPFNKRPADITAKKQGCQQCGRQVLGAYHKKDSAWFAAEGARVHGNKYNYSQVRYTRYHEKVDIICPEHGPFQQTAGSHISNGSGCPTCSIKDYEGGYGHARFKSHPEIKDRPAILYLIECVSGCERFIKIGITQKTVHERFNVNNRIPYEYTIIFETSGQLFDLFLLEQHIKKSHKQSRHVPAMSFNGKTECFKLNALDAIVQAISNPTSIYP